MRVRGLLLAGAALLSALALPNAGAATALPPPGRILVTGIAGTMAEVTFPRDVTFSNGGGTASSVADRGGYSAVVLIAKTGGPRRATLVEANLSEALRCPARRCPYTAGGPPVIGQEDGNGGIRLPAGRYYVALAGAPGATVTATLTPTRLVGTVKVRTTDRIGAYRSAFAVGLGADAHELQIHAFGDLPTGKGFSVAALYGSVAVDTAGALIEAGCFTTGTNNATVQTAGGIAPCADHMGEDLIIGPDAGIVVPASVAALGVAGPANYAYGLGLDLSTVATVSHLRTLFVAVQVP